MILSPLIVLEDRMEGCMGGCIIRYFPLPGDTISPSVTLKRGLKGCLYNAAVEGEAGVGKNPIVTLEKQLLSMIGKLV